MKYIFFTHSISGHFLEYTYHQYNIAVQDLNNEYIFVVPNNFERIKDRFIWSPSVNVRFEYFDAGDLERPIRGLISSIIFSWKFCCEVKKYVKKYKADKVFTNFILGFVPFAPLFFCKNFIDGILYKIYLYELHNCSKVKIFIEQTKVKYLASCHAFDSVYVLNDFNAANTLNKKFNVKKFKYLTDPYVPIDTGGVMIRKMYNIDNDDVLFSHFGALNSYKSTCDILRSILLLSKEERKKYVFVIAGKVSKEIEKEFKNLYNRVCYEVRVIVRNEFCDYEYLAALANESDAILIPYKQTSQSSGIIGYADQFRTPVIGPSGGLLGSLINRYHLGITLEEINAECLVSAYRQISKKKILPPSGTYCKEHTVENFQSIIFDGIVNRDS